MLHSCIMEPVFFYFFLHVRILCPGPSNGCNVTEPDRRIRNQLLEAEAVDRGFFIAEIEACSDMMYRVAWSILRNDDDVQDALQDAALKAWEKRDRLREEKYFRTWITRILINVCYDAQRKHRKIVPIHMGPDQPAASAPDPDLAIALEAVPEKLRLPLVLCCSEGMTYEEAAEVLRIPVSTLQGRLRRGKEALRKELKAE